MIEFSESITIRKPPEEVFDFLCCLPNVQQAGGSPVVLMETLTPNRPGPGFRYREVVQMFPFYRGGFISEIASYERPWTLELVWTAPGMSGQDRYELLGVDQGTQLSHTKRVNPLGLLRLAESIMRAQLIPRLQLRLQETKPGLEGKSVQQTSAPPSGM